MDYFPIEVSRHGQTHYFIWLGNDASEEDRIMANDGAAIRFDSQAELKTYATVEGIPVNLDAVTHSIDLDAIASWTCSGETLPAKEILSTWNLLRDFRDFESPEWAIFMRLSDHFKETHRMLSMCVISMSLSDNGDSEAEALETSALTSLLRSGIVAFDTLLA